MDPVPFIVQQGEMGFQFRDPGAEGIAFIRPFIDGLRLLVEFSPP